MSACARVTKDNSVSDVRGCVRVRACVRVNYVNNIFIFSCAYTHARTRRARTHTGVLSVLTIGILIAGYGHTAIHTEQAAHMLHGVCMCIRTYVRRFDMHINK
jgi:hypothetical protein